jgi:hypothetical protein
MAGDGNDKSVPGGVYLCQVGENVSCGACCGLYNVADPSFANLNRMLAERTAMFSEIPRQVETILDFGRRILENQVGRKPLTEFHHCPYIGFVGPRKSRVGCLLHPLADGNKGVDLRGLSDYGGLACRDYFCPAYAGLGPEIKELIRRGAPRWYEYGMMVTEVDLLNEIFRFVRQCRRTSVQIEKGGRPDRAGSVFEIVSALKSGWGYGPKSEPATCHYFFRDGLYHRLQVVYPDSAGPSRYHVILRELCSHFETTADLRHAEQLLSDAIHRLASTMDDRSTAK